MHLAFLADNSPNSGQLSSKMFRHAENIVQKFANSAQHAVLAMVDAQPEVSLLKSLQYLDKFIEFTQVTSGERFVGQGDSFGIAAAKMNFPTLRFALDRFG
jgi:hypothetical protein